MKINRFSVALFAMMVVAGMAGLTGCQKSDKATVKEEAVLDTTPPVLYAYSMQTPIGEKPDYMKDVEATRNGKKIDVKVDDSKVDLSKPGDYELVYSTADTLGVNISKSVTLHVFNPRQKIVYLTFDDGPSPNTRRILEILKDFGVHATFFVTGQEPGCFNYIKRAHNEGHAIAVHTYTHNFAYIYKNMENYFEDLEKMNKVIEELTGKRSQIIRFPGGSSNTVFTNHNDDPEFMLKLMKEVQNRGYQFVDWNGDSEDASEVHAPVEKIEKSACSLVANDICLLMHDTYGKETTVAALPKIIEFFKNHGYEFGTLTSTGYINHHDPERSMRWVRKKMARRGKQKPTETTTDATTGATTKSKNRATGSASSTKKSSDSKKDTKTNKKNSTPATTMVESANQAVPATTAQPANSAAQPAKETTPATTTTSTSHTESTPQTTGQE